MSFLPKELAEMHEESTGHRTGIAHDESQEDGRVLVYCLECDWEMWGYS